MYGGGGGKSSGRDARGATGGDGPPKAARDGGGGGPPRGEVGGGGARFQLGSQLVLEEGVLDRRSRVFVTLVTPASLTFSALAFSSATGGKR